MSNVDHPVMSQKSFAAVVAALVLVVLTIAGARVMGVGHAAPLQLPAVDAVRMLQFEDADKGQVIVRDAETGDIIRTFGVGEGAFLRATLRALVNDRRHKAITQEGDFRLERRNGSQLYLIDEATGRQLTLNAYGPDNSAVFAAFMSNQKGEGL